MSDVPLCLFYRLLTQCGMGARFDEQSRPGREGSRSGSLPGDVSHLNVEQGNSCRYRTSSGRLVHRLFWAAARFELQCQKSPMSHAKQAKVLAEGTAASAEAASTIHLRICMSIAPGIFCSWQFAEFKHIEGHISHLHVIPGTAEKLSSPLSTQLIENKSPLSEHEYNTQDQN